MNILHLNIEAMILHSYRLFFCREWHFVGDNFMIFP